MRIGDIIERQQKRDAYEVARVTQDGRKRRGWPLSAVVPNGVRIIKLTYPDGRRVSGLTTNKWLRSQRRYITLAIQEGTAVLEREVLCVQIMPTG